MTSSGDSPYEARAGIEPVLGEPYDFGSVTDKITGLVLTRHTPKGWWLGFGIGATLLGLLLLGVSLLFAKGVGIWGINIPIGWGFAIVNFVWWIGIGHAGTLISAFLLLMNQKWRTSINRFAEAMTLFAVACAGLFPILHLGRPWVFYWLFPLPSSMHVWPQFRSPLMWDVFAVSTYGTVSAVFWYIGLLPDLATLRDKAQNRLAQVIYGALSLGWRGSARSWFRYETLYVLLAGLATPLVLSVHTIVSFDFTIGIIPGWHSTIFPPYFVAGAIFSGFAMVLTICVPLRKFYHLESLITTRHLNNMAKILLATGLMVAYGYTMEIFISWYSGSLYEWFMTKNRALGPYAPTAWGLMFCNVITPQILWSHRARRSPLVLFIVSLIVNIGMWLERFVIVVTSLHRDFLPSSWGMYYGTIWDWAVLLGSVGLFVTLIFLFIRLLPVISMAEIRVLVSGETRKDGTLGGANLP